jgi:hypothetical protein
LNASLRRIDTDERPFAVDQLLNPDSIVYTPCGLHPSGAVVMGKVGTIGQSEVANSLYREFRNAIRRNCTSVKGNWLGREAYSMFKQGTRVAFSIASPPEYDLSE